MKFFPGGRSWKKTIQSSLTLNMLPPLQIGLPKGKDRLPTMNFSVVMFCFRAALGQVLAKRKVIFFKSLDHLKNNYWIIPLFNWTWKLPLFNWNSFSNNHGSGKGSFWGLGPHLPGPCDPLPWFWGKNQSEPWWVFSWETVPRIAMPLNLVVWVIYAMLRRGGTKGKWRNSTW